MSLPFSSALLVIDMQMAIDDPRWGQRNNRDAESNMLRLLQAWRRRRHPVFHVRHLSKDPASTYCRGQPGVGFKAGFDPLVGEPVIDKSVPTAFIGTPLESLLRTGGIDTLVIVGVVTNNSVEATARMAGNLGFMTFVVSDGTFTFGKRDYAGTFRSAEEVHAMSLANLDGEYATVISTAALLGNIEYLEETASPPGPLARARFSGRRMSDRPWASRLESVHPVLMSRDVAASVHFYERLGFSLIFQDSPLEPRYAAVSRDGVVLHLQWHDEMQWAYSVDRPTYRFVVRDVDTLYGEFRDNGALDTQAAAHSSWLTPGDTPWGTREFHVRDPDGNGLQFYRVI